MAFTHALSTNNYGPAKLIVATSAANGTHTTLAGAMADAVAGDTIFLRNPVTENITLTAGVNIAAWPGTTLNSPSITGKVTMTTAGTCNISGITLATNSDYVLEITGSAASVVNLFGCYLNCSNNTGIHNTSSSGSSMISLQNCRGDLGTTGIGIYTITGSSTLNIEWSNFTNSGNSVTASTSASNVSFQYSNAGSVFSTSGSGTILLNHTTIDAAAINTACITTAGTGTSFIYKGFFSSGTATAISIGAGTTLEVNGAIIRSSNTNAIAGSGTLNLTDASFIGSSSTIQPTITPKVEQIGTLNLTTALTIANGGSNATSFTQSNGIVTYNGTRLVNYAGPQIDSTGRMTNTSQPAFKAILTSNTANNVTGDGTNYTIVYDTAEYNIGSGYATGTGIFTAPIAGRYMFVATTQVQNLSSGHTNGVLLLSYNNTTQYGYGNQMSPFAVANNSGATSFSATWTKQMSANDTVRVVIGVYNSTKTVGLVGDANSQVSVFQGYLIC